MNIRRIAAVWAAKAAGFICKKTDGDHDIQNKHLLRGSRHIF